MQEKLEIFFDSMTPPFFDIKENEKVVMSFKKKSTVWTANVAIIFFKIAKKSTLVDKLETQKLCLPVLTPCS